MTTTHSLGDELLEAFEEIRAHQNGEIALETRIVSPMTEAEIKAIRESTGLSRVKFSRAIGVPLNTLRNYEQGVTKPDAIGRAFFAVLKHNPKAALKAIENEASAA